MLYQCNKLYLFGICSKTVHIKTAFVRIRARELNDNMVLNKVYKIGRNHLQEIIHSCYHDGCTAHTIYMHSG